MKNPESIFADFIYGVNSPATLRHLKSEIRGRFPFPISAIKKHNICEILTFDTGGALIHAHISGTFDDEKIVKKLREGELLSEWEYPDIKWDKYAGIGRPEKEDPEKELDTRVDKHAWLARMHFLSSLARVACLRKDRELSKLFAKIIEDFYKKNNPPEDIIYYSDHRYDKGFHFWSDLQSAWRVQILWWSFFLLSDSPYISDETWLKVLHIILTDSRNLYKYNSHTGYWSGNHQTQNMLALVYTAVLTPELRYSNKWYEFAVNIILQHYEKEIFSDGGTKEQCPGYAKFILMHYRDVYLLALKNGLPIPDKFKKALKKQYQFLMSISQPNLTTLPFNDSYEADCRYDFGLGKKLFPDLEINKRKSIFLPDSQIAIFRTESKQKGPFMACDASIWTPFVGREGGQTVKGGHWHGGKPGFIFWDKGEPLIVEAGVWHYTASNFLRWFRDEEGRAHNTVRVDGRGDSVRSRTFKWGFTQAAECKIINWRSTPKIDYFRVKNTGYESLKDPVSFIRTIVFVKPDYFIVADDLEGKHFHQYEWLAHFRPNKLHIDDKTASVKTSYQGRNVFLYPLNKNEIDSVSEYKGELNIDNKLVSSPYISYSRRATEFHPRIAIIPCNGKSPSIRTETIRDDKEIFIYKIQTKSYDDYFIERRKKKGIIKIKSFRTKSIFAFYRLDKKNRIVLDFEL